MTKLHFNFQARRARFLRALATRDSWRRPIVVAGGLFGILLARFAGAADGAGLPKVESLRVGFGNHYKLGCWTPVQVGLSGTMGDSGASGRLDVSAPDGDGVTAWYVGPSITCTERATSLGYARIGRADSPLQVRLTPTLAGAEPSPDLLRIAV